VDLPQLRKRLRDSVDELSKHVHARETTIIRDPSKQEILMENAVGATTAFLDTLEDCRTAIFTPIAEALDNAAVEALMSDSLEAVDELATHFSLDEVYVEDIKVAAIGAHALTYVVTGSAEVTLQWGSNLDLRAGDGAESSQSFPFRCELAVAVEDPWDLERAKSKCSVDTSAWHDMMTPDE
jgi:Predicted pPIWI-associating nuclease